MTINEREAAFFDETANGYIPYVNLYGANSVAIDVLTQDASFGTDSKGLAMFGKYEATPTTYTDGDAVPVAVDTNGKILLSAVDIQIGAVEIKNGTTDDRALVSDADTARATTDHVLSVQHIDETGAVLASMDANTNPGFVTLTDGTNEVDIIGTINSIKSDTSSVAGTATNVNGGNRDAGTQTVTLADDDPATVSLAVMDNWDESDRAKVNPIAGQAGIAANAGAMDALTTRVTIATDDTHMGAVGAAADVDGVIHGQLRSIAEAVEALATVAPSKSRVSIQSAASPANNNETQLGSNIDVSNYNGIALGVAYVNGDETKVTFRIYKLMVNGGAEYPSGFWTNGADATFTEETYDMSASATTMLSIDCSDCIEIKLTYQMADGTPTGTVAAEYVLTSNGRSSRTPIIYS